MKAYKKLVVKIVEVLPTDVITESVEGTYNIDQADKWFA